MIDIQHIADALSAIKINVEQMGDTLNLSIGTGLRAKKANIDPTTILKHLAQHPERTDKDLVAYTQGVYRALEEPPRHRSRNWTYEQSAGLMMPEIHPYVFAIGFEAVNSTPPWHQKLGEDLILTTAMVIDQGVKTISQAQVEQWGATDDRMFSAGRSMLFHKTRDYTDDIKQLDDVPVFSMKVGDGFDASRCMVIADVMFTELNEFTMLFGLPHQDILLYVTERSEAHREALKAATAQSYRDAKYPLSDDIFALQKGRPAPFV